MKLNLVNFKKHKSLSLEIPESGLIVLSGKNGVGKTTVMKAIKYAFYGNVTKPCTKTKSTCQVTLENKELLIKRGIRSTGKFLELEYRGDSYQDSAAQTIINDYLSMDEQLFDVCCMYSQRDAVSTSLLALTPIPQMNFIEKLTFKNGDCAAILKKLASNIKEKKAILSTAESLESKLILQQKPEFPELPQRTESTVTREIATNKQTLQELSAQKQTLKNSIAKEKESKKVLESLIKEISKLETEIEQLVSLKNGVKFDQSAYDELEKETKLIAKELELTELNEKLELFDSLVEVPNPIEPIPDEIIHEFETLSLLRVEYEKYELKESIHGQFTADLISKMLKVFPDFKGKPEKLALSKFLEKKRQTTETSQKKLTTQLKNLETTHQKVYNCVHCNGSLMISTNNELIAGEQKKGKKLTDEEFRSKRDSLVLGLENIQNELKKIGGYSEKIKDIESIEKVEFDVNRYEELKTQFLNNQPIQTKNDY